MKNRKSSLIFAVVLGIGLVLVLITALSSSALASQDKTKPGPSTPASSAQAISGNKRPLVILVEFAGTDVFQWEQGVSQWDPEGRADPSEFTGVVGDCSRIITTTTVFTYTGPLHNQIGRPLSASDASGNMIWTEDFTPQWFNDFLFGNGVVFDYSRQDASPVYESFTGKSVRDYFLDLSNGQLNIQGDVIGWLQVPHSVWYYAADQCPGSRSGVHVADGGMIPGAGTPRTLVRDALDATNAISNTIPGWDWENYDVNGDGLIDNLWIVYAGLSEATNSILLNRTSYGEASIYSMANQLTPPYSVTQHTAVGSYVLLPENSGMTVFTRQFANSLGATDLQATNGYPSSGFWSLLGDNSTGFPIDFEPPAPDPLHLDRWGWLNPLVITDTTQVYTVTIGQASRFLEGTDTYRGVKIALEDGHTPLPVPVWQGDYYWWGGHEDVSNARMTLTQPISIPVGVISPTLSFEVAYGIETEWDFLWVQVSEDGGTTWTTLANADTTCTHVAGWIGSLYGFPDDMCAAGIGGFTDYNSNFPSPNNEAFNLTPFVGKNILLRFWYMTDWGTLYEGPFLDNVTVTTSLGVLFADDAENGDANWTYEAPWIRSPGSSPYSHNYYLQWRNVNDNGGYDSALGDSRWQYGPANTGLLVWYNNNAYLDNQIFNYLFGYPGAGSKGLMLVVDSHPNPYREPGMVAKGYDNEGGNINHRAAMRDAPFTLQDTVAFTMSNSYPYTTTLFTTQFPGKPAVSIFNDALGYYPGAEYVSRGPGYMPPSFRWVTKQWDSSVVLPGKYFYGINAPGYIGTGTGPQVEFRFNCASTNTGRLGCYWLGTNTGLGYDGGTGNPGDNNAQYGWRVELIEEAPDHTWGKVRIYNVQPKQVTYTPKSITISGLQYVTYNLTLYNGGTLTQTHSITYTLAPSLTFVSSNWGGLSWTGQISPDKTMNFTLVASIIMVEGQEGELTTILQHNDHINPVDIYNLTTEYDIVYTPVQADFSGAPTSGIAPLNVAFTNLSTGNLTSSLWDFGDGGTSTQANPSHNYTIPGVYTVTLTASGPGGTDTETKTSYITVYTPVQADFSGAPTSGIAPLDVAFTNLSTGDFTTSLWDFGDGGTSTQANPSHDYLMGGVYTVTLTASGPGGTDTETKVGYITVLNGIYLPMTVKNSLGVGGLNPEASTWKPNNLLGGNLPVNPSLIQRILILLIGSIGMVGLLRSRR